MGSDRITALQLKQALVAAATQFGDKIVMYSLAVDENGLIYAGFVFNETPDVQMFEKMGATWIYVGDYWPYDSVWVDIN